METQGKIGASPFNAETDDFIVGAEKTITPIGLNGAGVSLEAAQVMVDSSLPSVPGEGDFIAFSQGVILGSVSKRRGMHRTSISGTGVGSRNAKTARGLPSESSQRGDLRLVATIHQLEAQVMTLRGQLNSRDEKRDEAIKALQAQLEAEKRRVSNLQDVEKRAREYKAENEDLKERVNLLQSDPLEGRALLLARQLRSTKWYLDTELTPRERRACRLRYSGRLTDEEAASKMRIPVNTFRQSVDSAISRSRGAATGVKYDIGKDIIEEPEPDDLE